MFRVIFWFELSVPPPCYMKIDANQYININMIYYLISFSSYELSPIVKSYI